MSEPAQAVNGWKSGWYVVPYRVAFRDIDAFGHVNNAVFLTYFEIARTDLWFELMGGADARDISFIVARAEIDFRRQLVMEPIDICVRVGDMRNSSFDFLCEIRRDAGREIAASMRVVVVYFDWKTNAKKPISDAMRQKVASMQGGGSNDA